MSSSAHVGAIHALEGLHSALMRFKIEAQQALQAADSEIHRTQAWLQDRLQYWQKEMKRRRRVLEEAQAALAACEAACYSANLPPLACSPLAANVARAQRALQEAEQELRIVLQHKKRVDEAIICYQNQARRLAGTLNGELLKGTTLLSQSGDALSSYAAMGLGIASLVGGGLGLASIGSSGGVSAHTITDQSAFSISDWTGYPTSATKPIGPFKVIQGEEYITARAQGNAATREYRNAHSQESVDKEIHHIHPIKFGGDPSDPANLQPLSESDHDALTVWWRRVQSHLERSGGV